MPDQGEKLTESQKGALRPGQDPRASEIGFGQILKGWLKTAGKKQSGLAQALHVTDGAVSKWIAGERRPDAPMVVKILLRFHEWLGESWEVPDALDGILWIGLGWEDVAASLEEDFQRDGTLRSFRNWWEAGRPEQPLPAPRRALPALYVEREELGRLRGLVTRRTGDWQPAFEGVVIRGIAGAGKTTLAQALAQDEGAQVVSRVFRDGVLWLDGTGGDLVEQARWKIGVARGRKAEMEQAEWEAWMNDPARRLLVVVDDLVEGGGLRDLLAHKGPQVVVAATTQRGQDVVQEMERWLPEGRVTEVELTGMGRDEGRELVERVLGRTLEHPEWERAEKAGDLLGWHPEGLRLAAATARKLGWNAALADLRNAKDSVLWSLLERLVDGHWERMEPEEREQAERLLMTMERGWPFGVPFAAAVWEVEPEQARVRLFRLEQDGLLERMAAHPVEDWWACPERSRWAEGGEQEQWRALPIVYQMKVEKMSASDQKARRLQMMRWRWRHYVQSLFRKEQTPFPRMPISLAIVATAASLFFGSIKVVITVLLVLIGIVLRQQRWTGRWVNWTVVVEAERHLRARWEQTGLQPTEELWLFYIWKKRLVYVFLLLEVVAFGLLLLVAPYSLFLTLLAAAIVIATSVLTAYQVAWRIWVACLYGVRTWDMEAMLRVALWLARVLGWIPRMRKERDVLLESLRRIQESK